MRIPARRFRALTFGFFLALLVILAGCGEPVREDRSINWSKQGDAVGFVDDEIVVWGRPRDALRGVLERLATDAELITCLKGVDVPLDDETVQALAQGDVEFELSDGGQQSYWWLLSAE